jgi:hypothetical protein
MTTEPTPQTRRRRFQFRLRTLLVVMLVVSLGMGWVMKERLRIAERRETLMAAGFYWSISRTTQPSWHRILYGEDLPEFTSVMNGRDVADAELAHLQGLTRLQRLYVNGDAITDEGLAHLQGLSQLQWFYLVGDKITDEGLVHLKSLTQLQNLYLDNTQVTDAGVAKLQAALPNCRISHMQYTKSPSHKFSSP